MSIQSIIITWLLSLIDVIVIKYWNLLIYVQHIIDRILQKQQDYVKVYVDDIVVFSVTLKKHLQHFCDIFSILISQNIYFFFIKFFLNYLSVQLLNQQVNIFSLITAEVKLTVIQNLQFLLILIRLKHYFFYRLFKTVHTLLCSHHKAATTL